MKMFPLSSRRDKGNAVAREQSAFKTDRRGDTLVVTPQGDSLSVQEAQLENEISRLHRALDEPGVKNLIVDVGSAPYFGSIIIGSIMALCIKVRDRGGAAVLCNASPAMFDVITIMKLDTLLPYFPTLQDATKSLEGGTAKGA